LRHNGVETVLYTDIEANPTHAQVNSGGETARAAGCDVVIGLGGGSAIDAAKAIAVVASEEADIWKIYEGQPITRLPFRWSLFLQLPAPAPKPLFSPSLATGS